MSQPLLSEHFIAYGYTMKTYPGHVWLYFEPEERFVERVELPGAGVYTEETPPPDSLVNTVMVNAAWAMKRDMDRRGVSASLL